jgi:two-component system nitrate/nitrite response regulator NarL
MTRPTYRTPALRAHRYRSDLPKVVTVHDNRFLAPGLLEALQGRAEVVGDTAYGAAALQLAQMLTPDVVVAGELLGDGLIDHFLPHLVRAGTRVLLVVEAIQGERALGLLAAGLSGVCSADDGLADLARAVLDAAAGGAVVPPSLVASIVTEWRSGRRHGGSLAAREKLTMREMEVLNAMADGLSTKAAARLLGIAVKTVESHRTRVFAKLGVRSQAQLVAARTSRPAEPHGTIGVP